MLYITNVNEKDLGTYKLSVADKILSAVLKVIGNFYF